MRTNGLGTMIVVFLFLVINGLQAQNSILISLKLSGGLPAVIRSGGTLQPIPAACGSLVSWLDFNSMQTWNAVRLIYPMVTNDYNLKTTGFLLMSGANIVNVESLIDLM